MTKDLLEKKVKSLEKELKEAKETYQEEIDRWRRVYHLSLVKRIARIKELEDIINVKKISLGELPVVRYDLTNQYRVEPGSSWNYNRTFDHSPICTGLIVKKVIVRPNGSKAVEFEQRMPFMMYDLKYFDGYHFWPTGTKGKH